MTSELKVPKTLQEAIILFSSPQLCHDYMTNWRWGGEVTCPRCNSKDVGQLVKTRLVWNCKGCKKQFSVKVGTIFEDSPLKLSTWLPAIWLITNAKNGISSCELARAMKVTQKTAWFMLHRIRYAMKQGSLEKFTGAIEADETFIGGREANKHKNKKLNQGRGTVGKAVVIGLLERTGKGKESRVKTAVIPDTGKPTLHQQVRDNVETGSRLYTDAHRGYVGLSSEYVHEAVDHAVEYVRNTVVHTNGLENYWSLLKRTIRGTYVAIDAPHLTAYLNEQTFRFNHRKDDDAGRFVKATDAVSGKRLTYKQLIRKG